MKKEDILVFDESFLREIESTITDVATIKKLVAEHGYFTEREPAEIDFTKKQIIPYVVLKQDDKYFCTERLKGGTEARLHNKLSIGMGGHVNPVDEKAMPGEPVVACIKRELLEEVGYHGINQDTMHSHRFKFLGVINEYRNEVEKVHMGLVFTIEVLDAEDVNVKEKTKLAGSWVTKEYLQENYDRLEGWSQIVFDRYII